MGAINWKRSAATKCMMNQAKNIVQHRDFCWCDNFRAALVAAATERFLTNFCVHFISFLVDKQ
jgi:hypothetical protein